MSQYFHRLFGKKARSAQKSRRQLGSGLEGLEGRQLMAADIFLDGNTIRIDGYDDPMYGETVRLDLFTLGDSNPYNDKIAVSMLSQRGDIIPAPFSLWKSVNGQWTQNVLNIVDHAYDGRDVLFNNLPASANVFVYMDGGRGNDEGYGGEGVDYLVGAEGNDLFLGRGGDDYLIGGEDADFLQGDGGNDNLSGGSGDDTLDGGVGADRVFDTANLDFTLSNTRLTGLGTDSLVGIELATLTGGTGMNLLDASAFSGSATLYGMAGTDVLYGGSGSDSLYGGDGNDVLTGSGGSDRLDGGAGVDNVLETANVDFTLTNTRLVGLGTDMLVGIEKATLTGGTSANRFDASQFTAGTVAFYGMAGNDTLIGGSGADYLNGGDGDDILYGGAGNDSLYGVNGRDSLFGDAGNDLLVGGDDLFVDDLWGGAGADTFYCYSFWQHGVIGRKTDKVWDRQSADTVYYF